MTLSEKKLTPVESLMAAILGSQSQALMTPHHRRRSDDVSSNEALQPAPSASGEPSDEELEGVTALRSQRDEARGIAEWAELERAKLHATVAKLYATVAMLRQQLTKADRLASGYKKDLGAARGSIAALRAKIDRYAASGEPSDEALIATLANGTIGFYLGQPDVFITVKDRHDEAVRMVDARLAALRAEVEAGRRDTTRLDWLECQNAKVGGTILPPTCGYIVRAYIDARLTDEPNPKSAATLSTPTSGAPGQ